MIGRRFIARIQWACRLADRNGPTRQSPLLTIGVQPSLREALSKQMWRLRRHSRATIQPLFSGEDWLGKAKRYSAVVFGGRRAAHDFRKIPAWCGDYRHLNRTPLGAFLSRPPDALRLLRNRDEYCEKQHERGRFCSTADRWLHKALEREPLSERRGQDFPDRRPFVSSIDLGILRSFGERIRRRGGRVLQSPANDAARALGLSLAC